MGKDIKGKELGTGLCQGKDGRYIIRWTDNYGKRHTKYALKLKEAKEILTIEKYKVQMWQDTETNTKITLNELFEIYLEVSEQKLKKSTLLSKSRLYNHNVKNFIGSLNLKKINKQTIRKYLSELEHKEGYNPRNALDVLKPLFDFALAEEYIVKNPTLNVTCTNKKLRKSKSERDRVLTTKEQEGFISFLLSSKHKYKYAYIFLLGSGLRIGELVALKVKDIDIQNGFINVNKSLKSELIDKKEVLVVGETKTKTGNRKVPLTELSLNAYKGQLEMFKEDGVTLRGEDVLFPYLSVRCKKIDESVMNKYTFIRLWDRQFKKIVGDYIEINPDFPRITPHSLRHTFATRCFEGNVSIKAAQTWLGHTSITMTQFYQHLTEENIKPEIERLSAVMKL